jgi:dihydroorotase
MLQNKIENKEFENLPNKVLLQNVHAIDTNEKLDKKCHIEIEDGKISKLFDEVPEKYSEDVIDCKGAYVMPGFFDMHVHFREPGREDEETIVSGSFAAANGGFTAAACMPNTDPPIHTQEVVNYIKKQAADLLVDVYPIAAISKFRKGEELAPIAELVEAGAVAISDDGSPVMNSEVMRRALEYSKMFGIPVLGHEEDMNLAKDRHMHEGFYSTKLGIQGIPSLSEEVLVARDIMLTEYTGGKFHVCHVSTKGSLDLVRKAKDKGLPVTCEVTPHHFTLTDKEVESFDTNTKMNPPLRTAEDVEAMKEGLRDGTIDAIATDHAPHSIEEKEAEYIYAPFGILGLETAIGLINSQLIETKTLKITDLYDLCVKKPREILNIQVPKIKQGELANLSLFDLSTKWTYNVDKGFSRSLNSPFNGWEMNGKSVMVINKKRIFRSIY